MAGNTPEQNAEQPLPPQMEAQINMYDQPQLNANIFANNPSMFPPGTIYNHGATFSPGGAM